jgi:hypothetical protein
MSRAEKIFKGVVATIIGTLGLFAKRDYDGLQAQKAKRKADLVVAADDLLNGRKVDDPVVRQDAEKMMEFYGLKPGTAVGNPQTTTRGHLPDGRI